MTIKRFFSPRHCYCCRLLHVIKPCSKVLKVNISLTPNTQRLRQTFNQIQPVIKTFKIEFQSVNKPISISVCFALNNFSQSRAPYL